MLGDSLFDAFIRAAKRGVDVRIIMPGIARQKGGFQAFREAIIVSLSRLE